jgi:glycosyltransferase involved in cell wall biosynthesis
MKICIITAGGAGMFCGSCMQDNTLVRALRLAGADAVLLPTYTPVRVDEENVSGQQVFLGGINVWLDSRFPGWARLPRIFKRWLDQPAVVRLLSRLGSSTQAAELGPLTVDLLSGTSGPSAPAIQELVHFISRELRPDIVVFSNALLSGVVPELRRQWHGPLVCLLQGDDIFLRDLPEPWKTKSLELIRGNCQHFAGFLTHSSYYAKFISAYLGLDYDRFRTIPLLADDLPADCPAPAETEEARLNIGYFARICPEKGVFRFLDAAATVLKQRIDICFQIGGFLPRQHQRRFQYELARVQAVGKDCVQWLGSPPERSQKFRMLSSFNWLCIPSEYQEPKGLYVLEAALAGVPSILPNHGAFPELIADLGAGMLFNSNSADALTELLLNLRNKPEPELRRQLRDRCLSVHGLTTAGALSLQALKTIAQLH